MKTLLQRHETYGHSLSSQRACGPPEEGGEDVSSLYVFCHTAPTILLELHPPLQFHRFVALSILCDETPA